MRVPSRKVSRAHHIICPFCESGELVSVGPGFTRCGSCGLPLLGSALETLRDIVGLPDALGAHPCECGHPEMRLLPDGVYHCPACGSEILPFEASSSLENARVRSASAQGRTMAPHPGTRPRRHEASGGKKQEEGAREDPCIKRAF